jgi:hypothetical protein
VCSMRSASVVRDVEVRWMVMVSIGCGRGIIVVASRVGKGSFAVMAVRVVEREVVSSGWFDGCVSG